MAISVREQYVTTPDGWSLHLRRTISPLHFDPATKPLLIVPGYGMNTFIFSYHPRDTSMERCLAEGGYEVWSVNLRDQGPSRPSMSHPGEVSLLKYARVDVPAAIRHVLSSTKTNADRVSLIGASLGGTIAYAYLALHASLDPAQHLVDELITMGAPLRWDEVHPVLRVAFFWPKLVGAVRMSGTRAMVRRAMPLLVRAPQLLSIYMNTHNIDMSRMPQMTNTVEDPNPDINRDIAHWIKSRDLLLGGINVTDAMKQQRLPLLVVLSNKDGIVPEATALTARDAWGGSDVEVLRVGDEDNWYAHANLFIADDAPTRVFDPIIAWLRRIAA